jgi:hypothetical protein
MKWLQALIAEVRLATCLARPKNDQARQIRTKSFYRRRRLDIQRCADSTSPPPPMQWLPCHPSTIKRYKATMSCSNGHALTLQGHAVDRDGTVSPSVVCPEKGCPFHAYVRLVDWTFGRIT